MIWTAAGGVCLFFNRFMILSEWCDCCCFVCLDHARVLFSLKCLLANHCFVNSIFERISIVISAKATHLFTVFAFRESSLRLRCLCGRLNQLTGLVFGLARSFLKLVLHGICIRFHFAWVHRQVDVDLAVLHIAILGRHRRKSCISVNKRILPCSLAARSILGMTIVSISFLDSSWSRSQFIFVYLESVSLHRVCADTEMAESTNLWTVSLGYVRLWRNPPWSFR